MPNSQRCGKRTASEHHRNPDSKDYRVVIDTINDIILSDYKSDFAKNETTHFSKVWWPETCLKFFFEEVKEENQLKQESETAWSFAKRR